MNVGIWLRVTKVRCYLPEQAVPYFVLFLSPVAAVEFQNWSISVGLKHHQERAGWIKSELFNSLTSVLSFSLFFSLYSLPLLTVSGLPLLAWQSIKFIITNYHEKLTGNFFPLNVNLSHRLVLHSNTVHLPWKQSGSISLLSS